MLNLFSRRGILFPSSEIYDSHPSGFWDYGPYGAAIKRKLADLWRREVVERTGMVEIDGSICMASDVFRASGHLDNFSDPLVECGKCGSVFRADKLIEDVADKKAPEAMTADKFDLLIAKYKITCASCRSPLSATRKFNMMFKVSVGASKPQDAYLRPETCQSIFADFPRLVKVMKKPLPLGVAQVGKSFRNEISPRNAIIRAREFTQAEAEVFFDPSDENASGFDEIGDVELNLQPIGEKKDYVSISASEAVSGKILSRFSAYYLAVMHQFFLKCGIPADRIRNRKLGDDEKAFYAKESWDTEVKTSLGWVEIVANNNRSDFDMSSHAKISGKDVGIVNSKTNQKFIPHIWEISMGMDRLFYCVEELLYKKEGGRVFIALPPQIAPYHAYVFPLVNKDGLPEKSEDVVKILRDAGFGVDTETRDSIGKRYARADEIGVPFCVTIDYGTLNDNSVTIRERNTTRQERCGIADLAKKLGASVDRT